MGYRVKGTLKLPDGTPGTNCEIEFTSRKNFTPMLTGMGVSIRTDSAGAYDVTLEYGAYAVILRTGSTYPTAIGQIIVASDTVVGLDLPTLLEQSGWQPATPEYIQQITKWLEEANASATMATASASAAKVSETNSKASEIAAEADRSEVAVNTADVRVKHSDVVAKSAQVSIDSSATQAAKSTAVSAADTATQKALAAAESEASAFSSATRSEASAVKSAGDGAAQAALAKSQADRAKSEADRASQISGLDTVSDAIGMAALPLPDVWAPLSDSLRMITGYGRDVLVGSDVVARMVNFSRNSTATYIGKDGQLKTASANEPRFEKEGLLIEGQSTNLNPRSHQFNWQDGYGASPAVQSPNTDPQTSSLITTIDVTAGRRRPFIAGIMTAGKTYTISFRAKSDGGVISQIASQLTGAVYPAVAPGEWKTYSFTGVATGSAVDFQITGTSVSIAWIQVEELPFASSYIPTNGAAVTRAADVCWIDKNNLPTGGFSVAVNFESRCVSVNPADSNYSKIALLSTSVSNSSIKLACGKDTASGITTGAYGWAKNTAGAITYFTGSLSVQIPRYQGCMKLAVSSIRCRFGVNDEFVSAAGLHRGFDPTDILLGAYRISGSAYGVQHIRNLRIWNLDLTDDQLKAVA